MTISLTVILWSSRKYLQSFFRDVTFCVISWRLRIRIAWKRYGQNNLRSFEKNYFNFASIFGTGSQVWEWIFWKTLPYSKDIDLFYQIKKIEIRFRSCRSREWEIHHRGFWQFRRFLDKNSSISILFSRSIGKRIIAFDFSSAHCINKIIKSIGQKKVLKSRTSKTHISP